MIQQADTGHSPGTVVLAAGMQPRYHEFQQSLANVIVPEGTIQEIVRSCDVAQNFNKGVRRMQGEWAWFLGDDHAFEPDTLLRLLNHQVSVVVPISPCRTPFGFPCVIRGPYEPGTHEFEGLQTYCWADLSGAGLKKLPKGDFVGQAGMLVRKWALDDIGDPWFKCGMFNRGRLQEDMWFCHELQQLGYTVWIDQDIIFDHHTMAVVTAHKRHDVWTPALSFEKFTVVLLDGA